jgi:hypothetical protein
MKKLGIAARVDLIRAILPARARYIVFQA